MPSNPKLGLIAGNGKFPFLVLEAARAQGLDVVVAATWSERCLGGLPGLLKQMPVGRVVRNQLYVRTPVGDREALRMYLRSFVSFTKRARVSFKSAATPIESLFAEPVAGSSR